MGYQHIFTFLLLGTGITTAQYSYETSQEEAEKISFELSGRDFPSSMMDTIDPYIKVFGTSNTQINPVLVGATEVIQNDPNPEFEKFISFPWQPGTNQMLNLVLMDESPLRDTKMGEVEVDADKVADAPVGGLTLKLKKGTILVRKVVPLKFRLDSMFNKAEGVQGTPFLEYYWRRGGEKGLERIVQTGIKFNKRLRTFTMNGNVEFPRYAPKSGMELVFKIRTEVDANELGKVVVPLDELAERKIFKSKEIRNDKGSFTIELQI